MCGLLAVVLVVAWLIIAVVAACCVLFCSVCLFVPLLFAFGLNAVVCWSVCCVVCCYRVVLLCACGCSLSDWFCFDYFGLLFGLVSLLC